MKKVLVLAIGLVFSAFGFAQSTSVSLENSTGCDLNVQLYTMNPGQGCDPGAVYNYVVPANGGSVYATPAAGEEFVYAEITVNPCGAGLALEADPACVNCTWSGTLSNKGTLNASACGCGIITAYWSNCNDHFIFY